MFFFREDEVEKRSQSSYTLSLEYFFRCIEYALIIYTGKMIIPHRQQKKVFFLKKIYGSKSEFRYVTAIGNVCLKLVPLNFFDFFWFKFGKKNSAFWASAFFPQV